MTGPDFTKNDGLLPAIAQDYATGEVLMLAWMNAESFAETVRTGRAVYWSRSRGRLWRKGEESGHVQAIRGIYVDCDADTILLRVDQTAAACHEGYRSCFFREVTPEGLKVVAERLVEPSEVYSNKATSLSKTALLPTVTRRSFERPKTWWGVSVAILGLFFYGSIVLPLWFGDGLFLAPIAILLTDLLLVALIVLFADQLVTNSSRERRQFGISKMLQLTAVFAVYFAALRAAQQLAVDDDMLAKHPLELTVLVIFGIVLTFPLMLIACEAAMWMTVFTLRYFKQPSLKSPVEAYNLPQIRSKNYPEGL